MMLAAVAQQIDERGSDEIGADFELREVDRLPAAGLPARFERLEDRTLFATAIWTGGFNTTPTVAPPSPFPTMPPFPPTLNLHAGFAQPFWSIPQNWVNNYVPQNGDDISPPHVENATQLPESVIVDWMREVTEYEINIAYFIVRHFREGLAYLFRNNDVETQGSKRQDKVIATGKLRMQKEKASRRRSL